ncbi:MAG: Unknown protein [uncultured Sulfurovum sp.]|uniref:DUF1882 domain-containing protein n=1 Tax=uncultured Sulfurovum sp. TaxID=269237 RepID=A0A6S6SPE1_9BACT|nr:MAG: Unknown protein [uncultured Sulfurovum sp.]
MKVFNLELFDSHYYIKHSTIVEQIQFNNRTFYAKFERINEPLTPLLLKQHFDKQYTIAVPLLQNNHTNYLVIDYKGEEHQRFYHLVQHLFKTLDITRYHIYQGKTEERLRVFIEVDTLKLEEADEKLQKISDALKQKMVKKWKCLPSISLPEAYNIVTLPYAEI